MGTLFEWLQTTDTATAIASSTALTGALSAVHVVGFVLATGGALVANLQPLGLLLARRPRTDVVGPANRVVLLGLVVSLLTGAFMFAARATTASENGTFRLKMLLLVAAVLVHLTVNHFAPAAGVRNILTRAGHALSLLLWLGLAVTACAFILLE